MVNSLKLVGEMMDVPINSEVDFIKMFKSELAEHSSVVDRMAAIEKDFDRLAGLVIASLCDNHKLLVFGNGGSAADAQHLATEMTVRFRKTRMALPAIALTTDTSALTATGNDFGFDLVFARQIEALGAAGDVAIGITTSGRSPNVLAAFHAARKKGVFCIALTGESGAHLSEIADVVVVVPSTDTARIQEMHITIVHALCAVLDQKFG